MQFQLKVAVLGHTPTVSIDQGRFEALKASRRVLIEALAIEEKYEILLTNYIAFEQEILRHAASDMIRNSAEYYEFYESRRGFNVCLVNLLTAAKLYADQFPRHVRACLDDGAGLEQAKILLNKAYDAAFEYRFMEALRNHVQHNGIPVHRVSMGASRTSEGMVEYGLAIVAIKKFLEEDPEFKKSVLEECPDEVDLMLAARSYMGSFGEVHHEARLLIQEQVNAARQFIEEARNEYESAYSPNERGLVGLEAQALDDEMISDRVPLLLDWDDVRLRLQERNTRVRRLASRYVSGQSRAK